MVRLLARVWLPVLVPVPLLVSECPEPRLEEGSESILEQVTLLHFRLERASFQALQAEMDGEV